MRRRDSTLDSIVRLVSKLNLQCLEPTGRHSACQTPSHGALEKPMIRLRGFFGCSFQTGRIDQPCRNGCLAKRKSCCTRQFHQEILLKIGV